MDFGRLWTPLLLPFTALLVIGCAADGPAPVRDIGGGVRGDAHYEVQSGDTLYGIAWDHGLDHNDLAAWNDIDSPDQLRTGQELRLRPPSGDTAREARAADPAPSPSPRQEEPDPSADDERVAEGDAPGEWIWPTDGDVVEGFVRRDDGKQGINIDGSVGQDVVAAAAGRVVYSGSGLVGYGNLIVLKHGGDYLSAYGYNSRLLVEEGDEVEAGDVIAEMGNARGSSEARLHFELRRAGQAVDPEDYLP
ncbi:peptidoglycan DD-metalloendopeptidase family protein [Aquisalimonas asiatica]|uniref:Lipoprotein NlpD n=1 Tax=Aquisalimonas asiatica TaxID=406100 RepID=A0A1H8QHX3_9GAMM|nr:peptidoglycan DD-metalloendopeptidase family protein [Aquisalimonas asiatica]SEO53819.1 lipoprotein NlpD [Aquisalimonas asiatica]